MGNPILDTVKNPTVLEAMAALAQMAPAPEGPMIAAGLRLAAAWLRAGLSAEQANLIVAKYSAEAQALAADWE
jgi:hypothetical protein